MSTLRARVRVSHACNTCKAKKIKVGPGYKPRIFSDLADHSYLYSVMERYLTVVPALLMDDSVNTVARNEIQGKIPYY